MSQTRRFIQPFQVAENWNMLTSTSSAGIDISNVDDISIVYSWTGSSPVGTLFVQVRNGETCPWTSLDIAPPASIATNSGSNNIQITNVSFQGLRLTYTASSGSGTLNAWLTGKGR
jgi:hypothetical protein